MEQVGIEFIFSAARALAGVTELTRRMFSMANAQRLMNQGFSMMMNTMPAIQQTMMQMEKVITHNLVYPLQQQVLPVLRSMMDWVREHRVQFVQLGKIMANVFVVLLDAVKTVYGAISRLFGRMFETIFGKTRTAFQMLVDYLNLVTLKMAFVITFMSVSLESAVDFIGDKFETVFNSVILPVWNKLADVIKYVGTLFDDPKKALEEFDASTQALAAGSIVLLTVNVSALAFALGTTLFGALVSATTAVWAFTTALLANPITWITLAVVGLVYALVKLYQNFDQVSESSKKFFTEWKSTKAFFEGLVDFFNTDMSTSFENIGKVLGKVGDGIKKIINYTIDAMRKLDVLLNSWWGKLLAKAGFKVDAKVSVTQTKKESGTQMRDQTGNTLPIGKGVTIKAGVPVSTNMPSTNTYNDYKTIKYEIHNPDAKQVAIEIRKKMEEEDTLKKQYNKVAMMQGIN